MKIRLILMVITGCMTFSVTFAQPISRNEITPFTFLGENLKKSYQGLPLMLHLGAAGFTWLSVEENWDGRMLENTSKMDKPVYSAIGTTGIYTGYLAPLLVPGLMYGFSDENDDLQIASMAVVQSVGIAFAYSSILKSITGRTPPDPDYPDKNKLSKEFHFSFFGGDMHYGWPSGHLMTNMAMISTLTSYYNNENWLKEVGYGYISLLAVTVLIDERGSAHWFSEIVAGTAMGYAIGSTVGRQFREGSPVSGETSSLQIFPMFSSDGAGLLMRISL